MFVQRNNVKAVKSYFNFSLKEHFSNSEIKLMVRDCVCSRLGLSFSDYLLADNQLLSESDLLYFRSVIKRLRNGEPFQYVMGSVHFAGIDLHIDQRGLIPRPETEELVDWIRSTVSNLSFGNIVDVCSGSGCIAFALEKIFPKARVIAIEYSKDAQCLLLENKSQLNSSLELICEDVLNAESWQNIRSDSIEIMVSNPPYIPASDACQIGTNVLEFEPYVALFTPDDDPLVFYTSILKFGMDKLVSGGYVFFEINPNFADELIVQMGRVNLVNITLRKDLQGRERFLMGQKS
jgi:release factor glutamine methyltransferase